MEDLVRNFYPDLIMLLGLQFSLVITVGLVAVAIALYR